MGGQGSGIRYPWGKKETVEGCLILRFQPVDATRHTQSRDSYQREVYLEGQPHRQGYFIYRL